MPDVDISEVGPRDALLQILERSKVLDDIATGVVEEDLPVLVSADRHEPLELVTILEEIVDRLSNSPARDDRDLGLRRFFLFCHLYE